MRILVVCTGNQHRSPMAQAILTALLTGRGISAQVRSAGFIMGGAALPTETGQALAAIGLDGALPSFRSVQATPEIMAGADLIVGMAREHVREVVVTVPDAWDHTFTLKELVRRGGEVGPRAPDEDLDTWLARVGEDRTRSELLGSSADDDVEDPMGGRASEFERTARE
ncbi:MAG TPA: hypothetical protein VKX24_10005, partial [Acidimicrobiia bacterium]|nr:hypothetical protein [Acidimicrobiia bacterium]